MALAGFASLARLNRDRRHVVNSSASFTVERTPCFWISGQLSRVAVC
jgi:hypothetical protein